jgi:hypothetical protein
MLGDTQGDGKFGRKRKRGWLQRLSFYMHREEAKLIK